VLAARRPLFKVDSKEARKRAEALERLETRIHEQEQTLKRLYRELERASEKRAYNQASELGQRTVEVQAALDSLMAEWEKLAS